MRYCFLYENFELYNPFITVKLIVWALFAGFVFASLLAIYQKRMVGGIARAILASGANSEETAKTISEIGLEGDWYTKNALRKDTALLRLVERVDAPEEEGGAPVHINRRGEKMIDFATAKFYIPEEKRIKAEIRYAKKGTDFFSLGVCIVIFIAAAIAAVFIIPELIQLIDNLISTLK